MIVLEVTQFLRSSGNDAGYTAGPKMVVFWHLATMGSPPSAGRVLPFRHPQNNVMDRRISQHFAGKYSTDTRQHHLKGGD